MIALVFSYKCTKKQNKKKTGTRSEVYQLTVRTCHTSPHLDSEISLFVGLWLSLKYIQNIVSPHTQTRYLEASRH